MRKTPKETQGGLSDLLKLGEAAFSVLLGAAQDLGEQAHGKRDALVRKLDLVTREEFEAAFAMIKKARAIQDSFEKRLEKLEGKNGKSRAVNSSAKKQKRGK